MSLVESFIESLEASEPLESGPLGENLMEARVVEASLMGLVDSWTCRDS